MKSQWLNFTRQEEFSSCQHCQASVLVQSLCKSAGTTNWPEEIEGTVCLTIFLFLFYSNRNFGSSLTFSSVFCLSETRSQKWRKWIKQLCDKQGWFFFAHILHILMRVYWGHDWTDSSCLSERFFLAQSWKLVHFSNKDINTDKLCVKVGFLNVKVIDKEIL